jgi:hypothetical protein
VERDATVAQLAAQLSDLRSRLVCTAVLCSAWCFVSRPLVSLVMPLSIRGSEKPCWMPLAQSSVKRVARLINCDQSWYDASFAGVSSGASSLLTVALVGCIRRLEKCCWVTLVGLRVSCSHRWYDGDRCQSPSRCHVL